MLSAVYRPLLLAIMLLLAQMGALFHAAGHLADQHSLPETACEWCTAFANVSATAPGTLPLLPFQALLSHSPASCQAVFQAAPLRLAYRSQAPPVLS